MPVMIHGKKYITVAERVTEAHKDCEMLTIQTEVLSQEEAIVVKATVTTPKGIYTGISAANPQKTIEKQSPYEVAETSAVGRALGFAGYGAVDSIASADEMVKAGVSEDTKLPEDIKVCSAHDEPEVMFKGVSKSKVDSEGNPKKFWWHRNKEGQTCFGGGYLS